MMREMAWRTLAWTTSQYFKIMSKNLNNLIGSLSSRRVQHALLLSFSLLLAGLTSRGADITFSPATVDSAVTDVETNGTLIFAYDWAAAATVNGVPFSLLTTYTGQVGPNLQMGGFTAVNSSVYTVTNTPFSALPYKNILVAGCYDSTADATVTLTLSNLAVGNEYELQFWVGDPRSPQDARVEEISGPGPSPGVTLDFATPVAVGALGSFTVGTFTADGPTEVVSITGVGNLEQINAVQLRDVAGVIPLTSGLNSYTVAQNVYAGQTAVFSATIPAASLPVYQWQYVAHGVTNNLSNGATGTGSTIEGVNTSTLTIANVSSADTAYQYTCFITNSYPSSINSPAAPLTLLVSTNEVINRPGDTITDFYNAIGTADPYPASGLGAANIIDGTLAPYLNYGAYGNNTTFTGPVGFVTIPSIGSSIVTAARIYTSTNAQADDPADLTLYGSNDGTHWSLIHYTPLSLPSARNAASGTINSSNDVLEEVDFSNPTAYYLYAAYFTNVAGGASATAGLEFAELQLLGVAAPAAPVILTAPVSPASTVQAGGSATFSVTALGVGDSYQWYEGSINDPIPGATNATLTVSNLTTSLSGVGYFCVVSNADGTATSTSASATVVPLSSVTWSSPIPISGDSDVLNIGTPVYAYDWNNASETVNGVNFLPATSTTTSGGNITTTISNYHGGIFTSSSYPFAGLSPTYQKILAGDINSAYPSTIVAQTNTVTLNNLVSGREYLVQYWANDPRGSGALDERTQTLSSEGGNSIVEDFSNPNEGTTGGYSGQYVVGSFTASGNNQVILVEGNTNTEPQINALQVIDVTGLNVIGSSTVAQNIYAGQSASFSVSLFAASSPSYQWQRVDNGVTNDLNNGSTGTGSVISGVTTPTLSISNVSSADTAYQYTCLITNGTPSAVGSPLAPLTLLISSNEVITRTNDLITDFYYSIGTAVPYPAGGLGPSNIIDGTLASYLNYGPDGQFTFVGPVGFVVTPSIGSSLVTAARIYTSTNSPVDDPADFTLYGSNDGTNWSLIDYSLLSLPSARNLPYGSINVTNDVLQEIDFSNTNFYKMYAVYFTNVVDEDTAENGLQFAELQLLGAPPIPLSFSPPVLLGNGNVQLDFSGPSGAPYRLWSTANLALTPVTNTWSEVASGVFGAVPVTYTDTQATNRPGQFYTITSP